MSSLSSFILFTEVQEVNVFILHYDFTLHQLLLQIVSEFSFTLHHHPILTEPMTYVVSTSMFTNMNLFIKQIVS